MNWLSENYFRTCQAIRLCRMLTPISHIRHSSLLHKKCFSIGQKMFIVPTADAYGGFLPVPLQQLFPSGGFDLHISWAAVFRWPYF